MTAPEAVVRAVMDEWQRRAQTQLRASMEDHARALAGAAFAASLEWAAEQAERHVGSLAARTFSGEPFAPIVTPHDLRRWARDPEPTTKEDQ